MVLSSLAFRNIGVETDRTLGSTLERSWSKDQNRYEHECDAAAYRPGRKGQVFRV